MKSVVVFCGSNNGTNPAYQEVAKEVGTILAKEKIKLIYGGGKVGLMGVLADAVLAQGGEVIGVIPHFLDTKEVAHDDLTELIRVESMHDRKMKMHKLCEGVITLPGGYGTMEELFEFITWAQLGLHNKPVGLLNVAGFYDALFTFLDHLVTESFLKKLNRDMLLESTSIHDLLAKMQSYDAPKVTKWIQSDET